MDITPFKNAIKRLEEGYARYLQDISDEQIRDGLIQRFEFTYELSHKTLKRFLRATAPSPEEFDHAAFQDLIRSASSLGLLSGDWSSWRTFREMRSKTSHTYDEMIALEVVKGIPSFLDEANFLVTELSRRLHET